MKKEFPVCDNPYNYVTTRLKIFLINYFEMKKDYTVFAPLSDYDFNECTWKILRNLKIFHAKYVLEITAHCLWTCFIVLRSKEKTFQKLDSSVLTWKHLFQ